MVTASGLAGRGKHPACQVHPHLIQRLPLLKKLRQALHSCLVRVALLLLAILQGQPAHRLKQSRKKAAAWGSAFHL